MARLVTDDQAAPSRSQEFEAGLTRQRPPTWPSSRIPIDRSLLRRVQHFLHGNPTIVPVIVLLVVGARLRR